MEEKFEKCIDFYYGEYKNRIFSKKSKIRLRIYPSQIEGDGFSFYDNKLSTNTYSFEILYDKIIKVYIGETHILFLYLYINFHKSYKPLFYAACRTFPCRTALYNIT